MPEIGSHTRRKTLLNALQVLRTIHIQRTFAESARRESRDYTAPPRECKNPGSRPDYVRKKFLGPPHIVNIYVFLYARARCAEVFAVCAAAE
jgi:hypothetical protein